MPRYILIDKNGPYKIPPEQFPRDGKSLWICGCGLSSTMPICDTSHKLRCVQEEPGFIYTYDPVTKQVIDRQPYQPAPESAGAPSATATPGPDPAPPVPPAPAP